MTHWQIRRGKKKREQRRPLASVIKQPQVDSLNTLILMARYPWESHTVLWNTIAAFSLQVPEIMVRPIKYKRYYFCLEERNPCKVPLCISFFLGFSCRLIIHCPRLSQRSLASCHILSCSDICQLTRADAPSHLSHSSDNSTGKFRGLERLHL